MPRATPPVVQELEVQVLLVQTLSSKAKTTAVAVLIAGVRLLRSPILSLSCQSQSCSEKNWILCVSSAVGSYTCVLLR